MKHSLHLYGTLGPACATKEKIRTMFLSGMTGMRLNLSHSNLDDCKDWLQQYYEVSERLHIVPELLVDLQGPELRIGTLDIPLSLSENDLIFLVSEKSFDKRKENSAIFSRIIAGEDELNKGTVVLKDFANRTQEELSFEKAMEIIKESR